MGIFARLSEWNAQDGGGFERDLVEVGSRNKLCESSLSNGRKRRYSFGLYYLVLRRTGELD